MARHPVQRFLHELLRRRPRCRRHVHVHLLEEGGGDEVAAAAEKAARLRPAERLAPAHRDKVGALGDEPPEILHGRHLVRGIHDDGHAVLVGDLDDHREIRPHALHRDVGDGHRARPDHGLDLLRLYLAHADAEGTVEETHLDESRAGHVEGLVVGVPVVTADHDLAPVLVAVVRHAIHPAHVETRDGRAGGKHERAEGPGRHQTCLRPRVARDHAARRLL